MTSDNTLYPSNVQKSVGSYAHLNNFFKRSVVECIKVKHFYSLQFPRIHRNLHTDPLKW